MFRKHVKLMQVQLIKNTSLDFMAVFLHLMFLSEKSALCDWFRSFVLNYTYTMLVINYIWFITLCTFFKDSRVILLL